MKNVVKQLKLKKIMKHNTIVIMKRARNGMQAQNNITNKKRSSQGC
jgi:hypothetical protein